MQQIASPKLEMTLPEGADFEAIWRNYVESLRLAADLAADAGLRLTIEGHAHVIVSGTDAMLRLFDQLPHPRSRSTSTPPGTSCSARYLPMSILKLGARIAHVHCRDGDGLLNYGLPPGQGIIDWQGVLQALREVGFDGFLTLELSGFREQPGDRVRRKSLSRADARAALISRAAAAAPRPAAAAGTPVRLGLVPVGGAGDSRRSGGWRGRARSSPGSSLRKWIGSSMWKR